MNVKFASSRLFLAGIVAALVVAFHADRANAVGPITAPHMAETADVQLAQFRRSGGWGSVYKPPNLNPRRPYVQDNSTQGGSTKKYNLGEKNAIRNEFNRNAQDPSEIWRFLLGR